MPAILKIYNSVEDQEPSKTFTCYRTTMAINNKLDELTQEINEINEEANAKLATIKKEASDEEMRKVKEEIKPLEERASKLTLESIQLFFPNFTIDDFMKLDPYDYQTFCLEIGEMRSKVFNRAAKN